jgi:hypothetical protein
VAADGTVHCWSDNGSDQLGGGTMAGSPFAVSVSAPFGASPAMPYSRKRRSSRPLLFASDERQLVLPMSGTVIRRIVMNPLTTGMMPPSDSIEESLVTGAKDGGPRRSPIAAIAMSVLILFGTIAPAYADQGVEIEAAGGARVDVIWASTNPFQGAFLWPNNASASQEFDLLDSGNGFYRIKARHSGQCLMLDWRGGTYENGTSVIQYPYCAADYAAAEWFTQWVWRPNGCTGQCFSLGSWYALIRNRATGKCLDARNGAGDVPPYQSVIQQFDCLSTAVQWNAFNQLWSFSVPTSEYVPPVIH